jgi:hypothetical protein
MPQPNTVIFESFDLEYIYHSIPYIPRNIDATNPLTLFNLYIPPNCYTGLYLGVSSSSLRTIRQCTSVVLVPRVEGEGFSASMCN